MTDFVVDASVAVKWLVREEGSEAAAGLLREGNRLHAPSLLYAEVANVLRTLQARDHLNDEDVREAIAALARAPLDVPCAMRDLMGAAVRMAADLQHPAYDCFYLALALREQWPMVTADRRFAAAVAAHPYLARHVVALSEL